MEKKLKNSWRQDILEHVPHGEEGSLQLDREAAVTLCGILLGRGYAVCITGGDFDDDVSIHWVYAGSDSDLCMADYNNVVFTNADYLEDYPQAFYEEFEQEEDTEEFVGMTD